MAGVNINWVASQLGNSPLMIATVYGKWINGEADRSEMAKLDTTTPSGLPNIEREVAPLIGNDTVKTGEFIAKAETFADVKKTGIGSKLAQKNIQSAQIIEFKRKGWSGRQDLKHPKIPNQSSPVYAYAALRASSYSQKLSSAQNWPQILVRRKFWTRHLEIV